MQPLYTVRGIVKKGNERGRSLGFPTANITVDQTVPEGVYVSDVIVHNVVYRGATFVGTAKTFNETEYNLESYILDFDAHIYGEEITVKLYKKIRGNEKFSSEKSLIAQIKKDVESTRDFFHHSR